MAFENQWRNPAHRSQFLNLILKKPSFPSVFFGRLRVQGKGQYYYNFRVWGKIPKILILYRQTNMMQLKKMIKQNRLESGFLRNDQDLFKV